MDSLDSLVAECSDVEKKLKDALGKLTVTKERKWNRARQTLEVSIRSIWKQGELEAMSTQLERIRSQVMMNVLMCVWSEARNNKKQTEHVLQTVHHIETAMEDIDEDLKAIRAGGRLQDDKVQTRMNTAIWASTGLVEVTTDEATAPPPYTPLPTIEAPRDAGLETRLPFSQRLLRSLQFAEMENRASQIKSAFENTFKWLLDGDNEGRKYGKGTSRLSFRHWLSTHEEESHKKDTNEEDSLGEKVFWITGIPASGKSTLMKFITTHPSLKPRLQEWAGKDEVQVAKFYFWNAGSKIQKSRVGLFRSLLYQLLSQNPELSDIVAPRRQLYFSIAGDKAEAPDWEWPELCQCFSRLAWQLQKKNIRLALFIDGLDEYEGFNDNLPKTHQLTNEMVTFLLQSRKKYDWKLCVSSRPGNYFRDKLRRSHSLAMQQLTQPDIDEYVNQRLLFNVAIQDARKVDPEAIETLISNLKTKARGVFLWVVLVVEQLRITAQDNPHSSAIRKVFDNLPPDLNDLYTAIQNQIGPKKQRQASKLYQLVREWKRTWNGQMDAVFLWLADEEDADDPDYLEPTKKYPEGAKHEAIAKQTVRVVEGCTRGILQVSDPITGSGPATVDFLHKTAYDWIKSPSNWNGIIQKGPDRYQPMIPILAVLVRHARSLASTSKYSTRKQCISRLFLLASKVQDPPEARSQMIAILDQLDVRQLQGLGIDSIFLQTAISTESKGVKRTAVANHMAWAAAWACRPYICGKVEQNPSILSVPRRQITLFSLKKGTPSDIPVLEIVIFGYRLGGARKEPGEESWVNSVRRLNAWQAWQRLETIKELLQKGAKIEKYMKEILRTAVKDAPQNSVQAKYAQLLFDLSGRNNILGSFDEMSQKSFPKHEVDEARKEGEFPDYHIDS
ncbi:uncharacterized protein J7T54_004678 [Emericellopsis cladophorae]|uniref:NACHT domain-containing protein n=1 Tax=Emericellopsis cladophorae TaxID=2686198 RepID=A0A9Q0BG45_9HYPO|nr:uncharacterized protein J7T54_004678 [Emericellopsis cladophorae]KAI6784132.1 hypothetical protein J7T54_004678 [Emericellopsis cladophorae]